MKFKQLFNKKRRSPSPDPYEESDQKLLYYGRYGVPRDPTQNVPPAILGRIFSYVCPHAADDSYEKSEESMTEDGCMLCDMRDLAGCALVNRKWYWAARGLL